MAAGDSGGPAAAGGDSGDGTHGEASTEAAAPSAPTTAQVAQQVEAAAETLTLILRAQDALTPGMAQEVTSFVSDLILVQTGAAHEKEGAVATAHDGAGNSGSAASEAAARSLNLAILQLARAATAGGDGGEVALSSSNLNLTTEARSPAELTARPVTCDTAEPGQAARVGLPAGLMQSPSLDIDPLKPVSVVLYTLASSLHAPASRSSEADYVSSRSLEEALAPDVTARSTPLESPTVAFSLLQEGAEVKVSDAASRINISVPFLSGGTA